MYDDKIKLKRESEAKKIENLREEHGERRNLDSSTNQNLMNLVDSGGRKRGEKNKCVKYELWKN